MPGSASSVRSRPLPLGEIQLITAPACRLFWMDASLSAENYSDLELSTSRFAAMQAEAVVFLGKVGFSISAAHLKDRRYTQYDGTFLLLDDDDHFDGALMNCPEALCVRVCFRGTTYSPRTSTGGCPPTWRSTAWQSPGSPVRLP